MLILAVGLDQLILSSRCSVLRTAGHVVVPASSVAESIGLFPTSDFDLLLLCHSMSIEDRDRLTSLIRADDSHIPIYTVEANSNPTQCGISDGLLSSDPETLIEQIEQASQRVPALARSTHLGSLYGERVEA